MFFIDEFWSDELDDRNGNSNIDLFLRYQVGFITDLHEKTIVLQTLLVQKGLEGKTSVAFDLLVVYLIRSDINVYALISIDNNENVTQSYHAFVPNPDLRNNRSEFVIYETKLG